MSHFYTIDLPIPAGLEGVFETVRLCSNGSVVVSYTGPVDIKGVNQGDLTVASTSSARHVTPAGAMVSLDVEALS